MKKIVVLLALLSLSVALFAADVGRPIKKQFISAKGDTLNYQVLVPENFNPNNKYPLVLFLHGAGERGTNNESQLINGGLELFANPEAYAQYPAIVLYPQCPTEDFWIDMERSPNLDKWGFYKEPTLGKSLGMVVELVDQYVSEGAVDESRMYVMGLSMGGMGTFELICRYPDRFAAAVPICGGVEPSRLKACAGKVAVRIFHGAEDDVVLPQFSRDAYKALKRAKADVQYTEYPGVNHGSWVPAMAESDFLAWMFAQQKGVEKKRK